MFKFFKNFSHPKIDKESTYIAKQELQPEVDYFELLKNSHSIIGAIAGDIIGSKYEWNNTKSMDFELFPQGADFTDDTVLTVAVADCVMHQKDFSNTVKQYGRKYTNRGYGSSFRSWLHTTESRPYNSWGNGSAMRVSAIGFAYPSLEIVLEKAKQSAEITHNHPEGIKGAQAIAAAIFFAKNKRRKDEIKRYMVEQFGYDMNRKIDAIRPSYSFDVSCQGSVPEAILAFLESTDYESAIRLAISVGGDSDTIACMAGGIAAAYYRNIPEEILKKTIEILPEEFLKLIVEFDHFIE